MEGQMDTAFTNAVAQRDAAERKIAKLKQQLEVAESDYGRAVQFIEAWEHFSGVTVPTLVADQAPSSAKPTKIRMLKRPVESTRQSNLPKEEVAAWAVRLLNQARRPLNRTELYEALQADGLVLHGGDPKVVMSTMLWRTKHIVAFHPGVGYWPQDQELPSPQLDQSAEKALRVPGKRLASIYDPITGEVRRFGATVARGPVIDPDPIV